VVGDLGTNNKNEYNNVLFQAKTKQLSSLEKQFEVLKWEYEVLQVRFDRVLADRDELKSRFSRYKLIFLFHVIGTLN
jgi:hypothetical protein